MISAQTGIWSFRCLVRHEKRKPDRRELNRIKHSFLKTAFILKRWYGSLVFTRDVSGENWTDFEPKQNNQYLVQYVRAWHRRESIIFNFSRVSKYNLYFFPSYTPKLDVNFIQTVTWLPFPIVIFKVHLSMTTCKSVKWKSSNICLERQCRILSWRGRMHYKLSAERADLNFALP